MVHLLRKLFIKDYSNTNDQRVRLKHGILASIVGLISNLVLCAFKIFIGLLVQSMTIIADAINNLTDMGSSLVNLLGFKISGKPADKEHPFGHERIEYIAGLIICFIIIGLAIVLGYTSVNRIINNDYTVYDQKTFIIAIVILSIAILIKLWQGIFYKKISKIIDSISLKAAGQDSINDVITTSFVLIATILEFILAKYNIHLDSYLSIAVSIFIILMGVKLAIETCNPLIGITPSHDLVKNTVGDILSYPGVLGVHDIMCHSYGPTKIYMTIHVEVDNSINVCSSHDLIDNIENEVGKKHNILLTIHMDPIDTKSPLVKELKEKTRELLAAFNEKLTFHDFRIVTGDTHTNILFDIVVPFDKSIKDGDLLEYLEKEFKNINSSYNLVIKIDKDYLGN